jgi:hypothetical protein
MAAVDYERVVLALKAHLGVKRSFGADELRIKLSELEVECSIPEGQEGHDPTPRWPHAEAPGEQNGAPTRPSRTALVS